MTSFLFNEIEFEDECDTDSQYCDSVPLFESVLNPISLLDLDPISMIPIPIEFEYKPLILDSHILLLRNECEFEFYDLDQTHELTPTLETKLDLSFIFESVSVPILFIVEPKSSILQNHILLLDQGLDQNDFVMISQDWSYNHEKFHARILHLSLIHI